MINSEVAACEVGIPAAAREIMIGIKKTRRFMVGLRKVGARDWREYTPDQGCTDGLLDSDHSDITSSDSAGTPGVRSWRPLICPRFRVP
jgi:hypothetical protein